MRLFFIVGAQKSGTTWLQRTLISLDGVHCLGEGHFIDRLVMPFAETARSYNQMMRLVAERVYEGNGFYDVIPDDEFQQVMRQWVLRLLLRNAKADPTTIVALGDKTPAHSFHIKTLQKLFPEARFLHMLRDGRDVAVSAFHHKQRVLQSLGQKDPDADLNNEAPELLHKWAEFTRAALSAEADGLPVHTVRYEDMLADPFSALMGCLNHIVPNHQWDESVVHTAIETNSFRRKSGRPPGQVDSTAFLRKGQAGGWREELHDTVHQRVQPDDQALLQQLGYDNELDLG